MDMFDREKPMTAQEVWEYLGVCRADFYEMRRPASEKFDPLLPIPDQLFSSRYTWKKGEVFDYLVARRAAARAVAGVGDQGSATVSRTGPLTAAFAKSQGIDPKRRARRAFAGAQPAGSVIYSELVSNQ
jgi:hypothetical protein